MSDKQKLWTINHFIELQEGGWIASAITVEAANEDEAIKKLVAARDGRVYASKPRALDGYSQTT